MKRRDFIRLTGTTFGASLMPASLILANSAMAQGLGVDAKKMLFVSTPNGFPTNLDYETWHPLEGTLDLRAVTAPLEPVKQDCLFIDGLSMYGAFNNTHDGGMRAVLTANGNDSLDVVFGELNKNQTPFSSLQMGPYSQRNSRQYGNASYKDGLMLPFDDKPVALYQKLWGADPDANNKPDDLGVLSVINSDLARLRKKLGTIEREKLEQHTDSLSQLERRLKNMNQSDKPNIDFGVVTDNDWHRTHNFYETSGVMQEIAVAALSMGLTRSINFAFGERTFGGELPGVGSTDHGTSHEGGESHIKSKRIWIEEVSKLIQRVKAGADGSGSLLDNTLIMHYSEIGSGSSHWHQRMPIFLAGAKNWGLNSGTTISEPYDRSWYGTPHHKLLTAIAQKAGLPINNFGDGHDGRGPGSGQGSGPLQGVFA